MRDVEKCSFFFSSVTTPKSSTNSPLKDTQQLHTKNNNNDNSFFRFNRRRSRNTQKPTDSVVFTSFFSSLVSLSLAQQHHQIHQLKGKTSPRFERIKKKN